MRRMVLGFMLMIFVTMLAGVAQADEDTFDWYDDVGLYLAHDVDHHFYEASVNFQENSLDKAASEIRTAIGFMKLEKNRAKGPEESAVLEDSIEKLDTLADNIEDGKVSSAKTLQTAFAEANHGLAMHHYAIATEAVSNQDWETAYKALKASQTHLERAIVWSGHKHKKKASMQKKKN